MKRILVLMATLVFALVGAGPALADSPHLVAGPTTTISGNSLTVTASIAGLGKVSTANFSLQGTVSVSSRCYTKSGNKPQAANKQETIAVDESGTFPVRAGRTNVSFTVTPLSTLTCPKGQIVVIESVDYDLTLVGEGLEIAVP